MALEDDIKKADFRGVVFTAVITALAFVVGLFWKDAITNTIDYFVPKGEGVVYQYVAAIIATIIVIVVAYVLMRAQRLKLDELMKKANAGAKKRRDEILSAGI